MTYQTRPLTLGGFGVFYGATRLETFTFETDADAYAARKNRVVAEQAEQAEAVYLARRAEMFVLHPPEPTAADIRATFAPGVR